jgi:hypothetical protein
MLVISQTSLLTLGLLVVAILATMYIMRRRVRMGKRVGKF